MSTKSCKKEIFENIEEGAVSIHPYNFTAECLLSTKTFNGY